MTPCGHFYHRICLKKWLFHQNNCPMCHQVIIEEPKANHIEDDATEEEEIFAAEDDDVEFINPEG